MEWARDILRWFDTRDFNDQNDTHVHVHTDIRTQAKKK
jgi:hypothetical protein